MIYYEDCKITLERIKDVDLIFCNPMHHTDHSRLDLLLYEALKEGGRLVWVTNDTMENFNMSGNSFKLAQTFQYMLNLNTVMINKWDQTIQGKHHPIDVFEYVFIFSKGDPKKYNRTEFKSSYPKDWNDTTITNIEFTKDHIKAWTNEEDLVYDPFAGVGTTWKACEELNRNFIGSEINKDHGTK